MKCSLCPKVALYTAGRRGFCGEHKAEAVAATLKDQRTAASWLSVASVLNAKDSAGNMGGTVRRRKYHSQSDSDLTVTERMKAARIRKEAR